MLEEIFNIQNYSWNAWAIPQMVSSIFFSSLGIFVLLKNRKSKVNIFFSLVCLATFAWFFGLFMAFLCKSEDAAFFWLRIVYGSIIFIPVFFYHFIINLFPELFSSKSRWFIRPIPFIHFLNIFLLLSLCLTRYYITPQRYSWGWYGKTNVLELVFLVFLTLIAMVSLGALYQGYKSRLYSSVKTRQMLYLLWAIGIYVLSSVDFLPTFGIGIYPFGFIFNATFIAIVAFTIVRYHLMEIDTVIHKTLLWGVTIIFLLLPPGYVLLVVIEKIKFMNVPFIIHPLISAALLLMFHYYYFYLRPKIDHIFRRRRYDYSQILSTLSLSLKGVLDMDKISYEVTNTLKQELYLTKIGIIAKEMKTGSLVTLREEGYSKVMPPVSFTDVLIDYLQGHTHLETDLVEVDPSLQRLKDSNLYRYIKDEEIPLVLTLVLEEDFIGLVLLGKRENLQHYTSRDIKILEDIALDISLYFYNALHHEDILEKQRLQQEILLAKNIQETLLPKEPPEISGIRLYGFYSPAKEIGGDYYDFLLSSKGTEGEGKKLYITIGDVSGKGLDAGLVVSSVKSSLLALIGFMSSPKDILSRLNNILFEEIKEQKFVSLLLFMYESKQGVLKYSSCGHEHIIVCRGGRVETIKSGGLILGMLDNIENFLKEDTLGLSRGDKVLIYTDGATEARNLQEELYGLSRLQQSFKKHARLPIKEVIHNIHQDIEKFISTREQYDDITLVGMEKE